MPERYPGIPAVVDDRVLAPSVRSMVEIIEIMTGQRKNAPAELQVVTRDQLTQIQADIAAIKTLLGIP